jgi:hypothetical protein
VQRRIGAEADVAEVLDAVDHRDQGHVRPGPAVRGPGPHARLARRDPDAQLAQDGPEQRVVLEAVAPTGLPEQLRAHAGQVDADGTPPLHVQVLEGDGGDVRLVQRPERREIDRRGNGDTDAGGVGREVEVLHASVIGKAIRTCRA